MKIAICDDEIFFAQKIEALLKQYAEEQKISVSISVFTSAKDFLESELEDYAIVFLDVLIGDVNGMDTARSFRAENSNAVLIFVSSFAEYARHGYDLDAFRYLLKDNLKIELRSCLPKAFCKANHTPRTFKFKTIDLGAKAVLLSDILYFESIAHNILIHLKDITYATYDVLSKMEEQLPPDDFIRVQRSYIVNMRNVIDVRGFNITLINGETITCSRQMHKKIIQRFLEIQGE